MQAWRLESRILPSLRWVLSLPGPLHLLGSCSMVSKGSFLFAGRYRLAGTMLGEAVIVMSPPGKHDGLLVCTRLPSEVLPGRRCSVLMREH